MDSLFFPPSPLFTPSKPPSFQTKRSTTHKFTIKCCTQPQNIIHSTKIDIFQRNNSNNHHNLHACIKNSISLTLFCCVLGFLPFRGFHKPAFAFSVTSLFTRNEREIKKQVVYKEHEFTGYTKRLLEMVSVLLKCVEDVRNGKGDVEVVKKVLRDVKVRKKELQNEIRTVLYKELGEMKEEKEGLVRKMEGIVGDVSEGKKVVKELVKKIENEEEGKGVKEEIARLEEVMSFAEKEYDGIVDRVGEIEDMMLKREMLSFSIGIRELSFIERECELLVERFEYETRHKNIPSVTTSSSTMQSKSDIQRELEVAQRDYWEQMLLPRALEVEDAGLPLDQNTKDFVLNIKQGFKESRELQRKMEARIRRKMKIFGDEKRFLVKTPADEVVKGYPEVELKWLFGNKEVVVPEAIRLHLFHGWKKWREEAKADLKRNLLENVDQGKRYVSQRQVAVAREVDYPLASGIGVGDQLRNYKSKWMGMKPETNEEWVERILVDRDRVVAKTWFNEERNRWEMDPLAVPYAVTKKLVENVRIRHDWAAMYVALKGDDKEYYVDAQELDILFEDFGGFDGLYLNMLASGIPTAVQLMWIPFSELDIRQQFLLAMRLSFQYLDGLWNSAIVSYVRKWIYEKIKDINEDIMMMIVFPTVDSVIPYSVRMRLGMAWPEWADQAVGSTWYLKWQSETEMSFKSRKQDGIRWFLWFLIRGYIYGYVLFNVLRYMKKKIPRFLGYGPLRRDPNLRKLQRVKAYFNFRLRKTIRRKREGVDPIASAFDQMKRIKSPPIRLKDFASVDSMREEINEVVAFLQNPSAFQEMGARAPRGVLIVGERGTGKTSLALAIASEAKVPLVEVKAQQLEAGLWVGQSASNAPVIIFVEDFDLFAGVRGKYIHTKKQDHEAFINQLLVELDGFEKQDGVVLMATTRNLKQIDQALQRPGRMDRVFHLQRPTQREREKILQISAKETMDEELIDFVDWGKVAEKTTLLRPIELKLVPLALEGSAFRSKFLDTDELMSYSGWFATFSNTVPRWLRKTKVVKGISKWMVNHLGLTLTVEDLQSVVDLMEPYGQISNGIELLNPPLDLVFIPMDLVDHSFTSIMDSIVVFNCFILGVGSNGNMLFCKWSRESKYPHAVWAAGRALIALLIPNFDLVDNVWLEPFSWEGIGCTKITKAKNEGSMNGNVETRSYLEKKLVFCFGSYIASQMLLPFGEENFLSTSEIKQAQEIATRMVIQYGWGPDDSPAIYFSSNAVTALSMGNNHEYEMATKVERLYDLAYDKAKEMLQKNSKVLERIVEELLEFEMLTGKLPSSSSTDGDSASGLALLSAPIKS
ncbi:hypothetical protein IFM89_033464 [Coptis chinensis]|uniref:AAA+ ATPase domain-containing protein n=1 Tax=Coptis chinensis TaxID=261450 RepID=A0A835I024_9MAGN|nr:hypothetical protein IFM89_033464 [Coptis chinensis]